MIKVKDLEVRFGRKRVLSDINVQFDKGEFVVIAGNNGVGKSTFLRTLMGIVTPVKGNRIEFQEKKFFLLTKRKNDNIILT